MPNIWHIWHTKHQKPHFIRCSKCHNFCHKWIVPLHICHCTDGNGITDYNIFLFSFLSPLSSAYSFLFSLTSVLSHRFPLTDSLSLINCWSVIADRHCRSIIADLSPVAFCIVIADLSGYRHRHCRSESTWASTLRWDRNQR